MEQKNSESQNKNLKSKIGKIKKKIIQYNLTKNLFINNNKNKIE